MYYVVWMFGQPKKKKSKRTYVLVSLDCRAPFRRRKTKGEGGGGSRAGTESRTSG
jgi:hypothetical protein